MVVLRAIILSILITLLPGAFSSAQTQIAWEYQLKAVFLFNFTQFVTWPHNTFSTAQDPLIIGILGDDPFGTYLKDVIAGEEVNGHSLTVQHYNNIDEVKTCHILFISQSETSNMKDILASLKGRSVLTVSDSGDFLKKGGMIRSFTAKNKIRLQINLVATKDADLTISSKLLRLAEIVTPNKNN